MVGPPHVGVPEHLFVLDRVTNYITFKFAEDHLHTADLSAVTNVRVLAEDAGATTEVSVDCVTGTYFDVLQTRALRGTVLTPEHESKAAELRTVISYNLWTRLLSRNDNAIGRHLRFGSQSYEIIGVMPAGFRGLNAFPVDAWILLRGSPEVCSFTGRNLLQNASSSWLTTFGRARQTLRDVTAELNSISSAALTQGRESSAPPTVIGLLDWRQLHSRARQDVRLWTALGSAVLFVVTCLNAGVLLSLRVLGRSEEFVVRRQLGATMSGLAGQVLVEVVILTGLAGCIAFAAAFVSLVPIRLAMPTLILDESVDGFAIATLVLTLVAAILVASIGPILQVFRSANLRPEVSGARSRTEGRQILVVLQVALGFTLAVIASLFDRSLEHLTTGLGYDTSGVFVATIDVSRAGDLDLAAAVRLAATELRHMPGIVSVDVSSGSPLGSLRSDFVLPSIRSGQRQSRASIRVNAVSTGYFQTTGTPLLSGRPFDPSDNAVGKPVAIIPTHLAQDLWPDTSPLGKCLTIGRISCAEVVGVSSMRRHRAITRVDNELFVPVEQLELLGWDLAPTAMLVRVRQPGLDRAIRRVLRAALPTSVGVLVRPLQDLLDNQTVYWRNAARLFSAFSVVAGVLSLWGIYAVTLTAMHQRTKEFAIRLCVGATPHTVTRLALRQSLTWVLAGIVIGAVCAYAVNYNMRSVLFGIQLGDAPSFLKGATLLVSIGVAGSLLPAVRAGLISVGDSLRA